MIDLYNKLQGQQIKVSAGEGTSSGCSGTITIVITATNNGQPTVLTKQVQQLTGNPQIFLFPDIPLTNKIHKVIATLTLETGEVKSDDELLLLK